MTDIERKTGMTDAECEYLDEYYTHHAFEPGPNLLKRGIQPGFARNTLLFVNDSADEMAEYLHAPA